MASATTTWRSPLSILMGARRNDDDNLELREDYSHSPASLPPKRTPAAAESTEQQSHEHQRQSELSLIASYIPFTGYFGRTSSSTTTPAADDAAANTGNNGEQTNNTSAVLHPPRGAFPPHISESHGNGRDDDDDDHDHRSVDHEQFTPSHPWFNQGLTDSNKGDDHRGNNPNPSNNTQTPYFYPNTQTTYISWSEQKSIIGTTFNFTNSIIGAGAMGLGGAFAASGGLISIVSLIGFAFLMKSSLDLVVDLSSCPAVIRKARLLSENSDDHGEDVIEFESSCSNDGSSSSGSGLLRELLGEDVAESNDSKSRIDIDIEEASDSSKILDPMSKSKNDSGSPPTDENAENAVDDEAQEDANDLSPPTAHADDQGENGESRDKMQSSTQTAGLSADEPQHPLMPSSSAGLIEKDRFDSLTMGVTTPRHFSPLFLNPEDIPHVNKSTAATSIQISNNAQQPQQQDRMSPCTYEELGFVAYGASGRLAVLLSKSLYSFGCLVAYTVVVRDNFGLALRRIVIGPTSSPGFLLAGDDGHGWLYDDDFLAFWVSAIIMLPLSCPRTMKPLAKFSFVSILSMVFLIIVVVYLFFTCTNPEGGGASKSSFYENWIEVRSFSGYIESLGCFVFTFVCHHTVNLAYESLPPRIRNPKIWRRVSTNSIAMALQSSLAIGVFGYLTFGSQTPADVLMGYPADLTLANVARLLLCLTMVLTFPLPFLTCREMSILICVDMHKFYYMHGLGRFNFLRPVFAFITALVPTLRNIFCRGRQSQGTVSMQREVDDVDVVEDTDFVPMKPSFFKRWRGFGNTNTGLNEPNEEWWDQINGDGGAATQALLSEEERETEVISSIGGERGKEINPSPLSSQSGESSSSETTISTVVVPTPTWMLPDRDGRQLTFFWHASLTFTLWLIVTICAIKSPSLGDVLDLVGAFTGTMLAFILPALFSFKLKGYGHMTLAILGVGGITGFLGTIFSLAKFTRDD